jgi:hypothetical protein
MILPLKPAVIGPFSGIFHRHLPSPAHVRVENGPGLPQKVSQQSCYGSAMVVGIWVGVQNIFFWLRLWIFLKAFFPGTICLVFATVWN